MILIISRIIMGLSMTVAYISLNDMIAHIPSKTKEGHLFGRIDSTAKYGGVAAGVLASITVHFYQYKTPFILASLLLGAFITIFFITKLKIFHFKPLGVIK